VPFFLFHQPTDLHSIEPRQTSARILFQPSNDAFSDLVLVVAVVATAGQMSNGCLVFRWNKTQQPRGKILEIRTATRTATHHHHKQIKKKRASKHGPQPPPPPQYALPD
jgi:hypothetical protein